MRTRVEASQGGSRQSTKAGQPQQRKEAKRDSDNESSSRTGREGRERWKVTCEGWLESDVRAVGCTSR